jgi:hypothetical protein
MAAAAGPGLPSVCKTDMIGILEYLAGLLLVVFLGLVAIELAGWSPVVARWIVRRAARRLPNLERERWLEEWYCDLDAVGGRPLTVLMHGLGILRASAGMRDTTLARAKEAIPLESGERSLAVRFRLAEWSSASSSRVLAYEAGVEFASAGLRSLVDGREPPRAALINLVAVMVSEDDSFHDHVLQQGEMNCDWAAVERAAAAMIVAQFPRPA